MRIPLDHSLAFNRALAERLGLDPAIVSQHDFRADVSVIGGDALGTVRISFTAHLPADELAAMFNAAGTRGAPPEVTP